jgi:hypothetical protein
MRDNEEIRDGCRDLQEEIKPISCEDLGVIPMRHSTEASYSLIYPQESRELG